MFFRRSEEDTRKSSKSSSTWIFVPQHQPQGIPISVTLSYSLEFSDSTISLRITWSYLVDDHERYLRLQQDIDIEEMADGI